jgi:hypothetical protein
MTKYFYEKNTEFLESSVNKKFEEILWMSKEDFRQWVIDMRKEVVHLWDEKGQPPRVGYNEQEIIDQFNEMTSFPIHKFLVKDELTGEEDVIRNTSIIGNAVNQWFPTMMKTRINYTKDVEKGKSIYDYFAKDELLETFVTYASRHFKRDSFYHYSTPVKIDEVIELGSLQYKTDTVENFVNWFETKARSYDTHDYWFEPNSGENDYTGYNEDLKNQKYILISKDDLLKLNVPNGCKTNIEHKDAQMFRVRLYKKGQKVFPVGLKAFRVSFCQYAVNFPPLTAKYLYERYTEHFKTQEQINIYDPSSGWGGRLLGALSIDDERNIHYIGTDPNKDHTTTEGRTKYHEFADFFNTKTYRATGLFPKTHTFEIYQLGSEEIHKNENFKKYKGKLDLIFTSPPYFAKEAYSEDENQSYKKFSQYDLWREGFLRKTLETCVEYLKNDRYLLWNIADAVFGGDMLPLEQDSIDILTSLGMEYKGKLKMSLAQMPGGNRVDAETGLPKAKNFCKVNGLWLKYEPVFIFYKPK